jgi:hypothetical protein
MILEIRISPSRIPTMNVCQADGNVIRSNTRGGGGYPTLNARLQMVCTFIDTLCKYTTCIMRSS